MSLREAWKKHYRGDSYSDEELDRMLNQLDAAMPYMTERPGYDLAARDACHTQSDLSSVYFARHGRHPCSLFQIVKVVEGDKRFPHLLVCTSSGMIFVAPNRPGNPSLLESGLGVFRSDLRTCRLVAKAIGDGCYVVNADTMKRVEDT